MSCEVDRMNALAVKFLNVFNALPAGLPSHCFAIQASLSMKISLVV